MCVEFGNSHLTNECRKPKNTPAKCCNTANYRGCTWFPKLQRKTSNRNNNNDDQNQNREKRTVGAGSTTYASAAKNSNPNGESDLIKDLEELTNLLKRRPGLKQFISLNTITPDFPNMVTWNANGLISKKNEPIDFLTDHNIDIVFLQETHLENDHVGILNYKIFRKDGL
ncbi:hypothetical protein JTB14_016367 [Gonioctena quinquepunctata]|nr:hypothetical protein JTB14_016367 [Gonioctena quinquepunctata]